MLQTSIEATDKLNFPGEGTERPFRWWLGTEFLVGLLGWPSEKVVIGERFDILLRDDLGFPVVTIETKGPYRKANAKEHADFEKRLDGYGTLQTAYFTNGEEWDRLDIFFSPSGSLEFRSRSSLHLKHSSPDELEGFFGPLNVDQYLVGAASTPKEIVSSEHSYALEGLAARLHDIIVDFSGNLEGLFFGLLEQRGGEHARGITINLFNLWCERSLIVPPPKAASSLVDQFKKNGFAATQLNRMLAEIGFTGEGAERASDSILALPVAKRVRKAEVERVLWPIYRESIRKLCVQTAHVLLARGLLYRIGEDQGLFPRLISGKPLQDALTVQKNEMIERLPAAELLARTRAWMEDFVPAV